MIFQMTEVDHEEHHVNITTNETFQEMVGFGAAMSGSSAWLIFNSTKRNELMHLLFAPIEQGYKFLKVSLEKFYTKTHFQEELEFRWYDYRFHSSVILLLKVKVQKI